MKYIHGYGYDTFMAVRGACESLHTKKIKVNKLYKVSNLLSSSQQNKKAKSSFIEPHIHEPKLLKRRVKPCRELGTLKVGSIE